MKDKNNGKINFQKVRWVHQNMKTKEVIETFFNKWGESTKKE